MFSDWQIEERGKTKAGGSSGVADRENNTSDRYITTKDTCGGITRRTAHSEEKTGGLHQRPHQAAHAGLALFTSSSNFTIYWFTFIFTYLLIILYCWFMYIFYVYYLFYIESRNIEKLSQMLQRAFTKQAFHSQEGC